MLSDCVALQKFIHTLKIFVYEEKSVYSACNYDDVVDSKC